MHKNDRFNIVQAAGNCNPNFLVIDGQRTDSGHMAAGARVLSGPSLTRTEAIALADKLQELTEQYRNDLLAACAKETPDDRRYFADAAHARHEERCEKLGIPLSYFN